jgi:hypothetical protein
MKLDRQISHEERLSIQLKRLESQPINEVITFTGKHRNLYKRLHEYRKHGKISESVRELIDIGLKSKGY